MIQRRRELTPPNRMTQTDQRTLDNIAEIVASCAGFQIGRMLSNVHTPSMRYQGQYVLEKTIEILTKCV